MSIQINSVQLTRPAAAATMETAASMESEAPMQVATEAAEPATEMTCLD